MTTNNPNPKVEKFNRLQKANALIKVIGDNGRNFFKYEETYGYFEMDVRGRVWWFDKYTKRMIYTHYQGRWRHFSDGGTLQSLVVNLSKWIRTGEELNHSFGPWPDYICEGDLWGYGEAMSVVRRHAMLFKIISFDDEQYEKDLKVEQKIALQKVGLVKDV